MIWLLLVSLFLGLITLSSLFLENTKPFLNTGSLHLCCLPGVLFSQLWTWLLFHILSDGRPSITSERPFLVGLPKVAITLLSSFMTFVPYYNQSSCLFISSCPLKNISSVGMWFLFLQIVACSTYLLLINTCWIPESLKHWTQRLITFLGVREAEVLSFCK